MALCHLFSCYKLFKDYAQFCWRYKEISQLTSGLLATQQSIQQIHHKTIDKFLLKEIVREREGGVHLAGRNNSNRNTAYCFVKKTPQLQSPTTPPTKVQPKSAAKHKPTWCAKDWRPRKTYWISFQCWNILNQTPKVINPFGKFRDIIFFWSRTQVAFLWIITVLLWKLPDQKVSLILTLGICTAHSCFKAEIEESLMTHFLKVRHLEMILFLGYPLNQR